MLSNDKMLEISRFSMIFNTCFCILQLEVCLAKSKNSFAALQKSRLELEAQIDVKANSIYIDEVKCMTVRASMQHQAY